MTSRFQLILIFLLIFASSSFALRQKRPKNLQISNDDLQKFNSWKSKHKKTYNSPEDEDRAMNNLLSNQREIEEHNKLYEAGVVTFKRKIWENSDLNYDDKVKTLTGQKIIISNMTSDLKQAGPPIKMKKAPDEVNWARDGLVNSIQNQGKCGSCWSFAAAGVVEGVLLKNGTKMRLSEQNLVDCNKSNYGCDGGQTYLALKYIKSTGISSFTDYPYTGKDGKCKKVKRMKFDLGTIKNDRLRGDENKLRDIVANFGPIAIAIDAADSFMNYDSGVYNNPKCSKRTNHAMLLVGEMEI